MKLGTFTVANILCFSMMSATAQNYSSSSDADQTTSNNTSELVQYITNWAAYLGYDIAKDQTPPIADTNLTSYANASYLETILYSTFFGSIPTTTPPVTSASSSSSSSSNQGVGLPFLPQSDSATTINSASNLTFKSYSNAGGGQQSQGQQAATITANSLVDQQPYQADPVSQAIFNILGTPDVSVCSSAPNSNPFQGVGNATNPNGASSTPCKISPTMFQTQLVENTIGVLPSPSEFYSITSNADLLPQLNSNSLIAPLTYSADQLNFSTGGAKPTGLTATNQAELAANFIRYASGAVQPTLLPNQGAYTTTYQRANDNTDPAQLQMQAILSNYLTSLRIYAAQSSVGIGNLYYILSKRIPQQQQQSGSEGQSGQATSQALNEYNMATWRIFQVGGTGSSSGSSSTSGSSGSTGSSATGSSSSQTQWMEKINSASPATVQKEIAILLAEINYQLYLDRQLQERMLMTSSVSLLQGTKATQPSSDLTNQSTSASTEVPQ